MPAFSSEVYNAPKEKSAEENYAPYADYLRRRAEAAAKWEGSATAPAPQVSLADQIASTNQYRSGEYGRREQAVQQQANLAKAEDTRTGSVADRVREALYTRQKAQEGVATQQSQQDRTLGQQMREQNQKYGQGIAQQEFTAFKNAGDRYDGLMNAYKTGTAEMGLINAQREGSLELADLDRYFSILKTDLGNLLADIEQQGKIDLNEAIRLIEAKANSGAAIVNGLTTLGGYGMKYWVENVKANKTSPSVVGV